MRRASEEMFLDGVSSIGVIRTSRILLLFLNFMHILMIPVMYILKILLTSIPRNIATGLVLQGYRVA